MSAYDDSGAFAEHSVFDDGAKPKRWPLRPLLPPVLPFQRPHTTLSINGGGIAAATPTAADYARKDEASFDASNYFTTFDFCAHPRRFLGHYRRYSSSGDSLSWEARWEGCADIAKAREQLLQCQARRPLYTDV